MIEPDPARGVHLQTYTSADPGPTVGDASVLSIAGDAYVAFAATAPGEPFSRIHVDHWVCAR